MKKLLMTAALGLALPMAASHAATNNSAQDAINELSSSIAAAELSISLAEANVAIMDGQSMEAVQMLTASLASAEMSISLAGAYDTLSTVSDATMLAELNSVLGREDADALIMATVAERPMLASAVQGMALEAGMNEAMVANAIIGGLGSAEATAAGQ